MIRSLAKKLFSPFATDIEKLLLMAHRFPRYSKHRFEFRGMIFEVTDFLSVAYQLKEYFVDERMKFTTANVSPVIYDCGSNVGVSVLYYKKLFPSAQIVSFEPDPGVYACLVKNLQLNQVAGVTLNNKAVWINNNGIEFGSEGADGGSVFFDGNKIKVATTRLKECLERETIIDCLKMDIEGAETDVLEDCGNELKKIKYLFVEYHSWIYKPQLLNRLLSFLSDNGFRYYIHNIGEHVQQPFNRKHPGNKMDVQLDIYAVNSNLQKAGA